MLLGFSIEDRKNTSLFSRLDFALATHEFSMPVGRVGYMYLEPLSFEEFLEALDKCELRNYLKAYNWSIKIPSVIHSQLICLKNISLSEEC